MKVVLFGATGMIGQGVLRECLLDSRVERVLSIGRRPSGIEHPKLREIITGNLFALEAATDFSGYDACFFCLGVSSAGMAEEDYRRVTYDLTLAAARTLVERNPRMTFIYVSGAGTDAGSKTMWARVKGETENALLAMPLESVMFRPALIQPMHGAVSRTRSYRILYVIARPVLPLLRRLFPGYVTTTEQLGRAMIAVAERGAPKPVLESSDINLL